MPTIETITELLAARNLGGLVGLKEDQWFDAKSAAGYNLAAPTGRVHLAKDVASFANAEGGYIIVGLTTADVADEQTEQVNGLDLLTETSFNIGAIQGVLNEYLFPKLQGVSVNWIEDATMAGQGAGVIRIPAMVPDRRFVFIKQVLDEDTVLPQIVFGIAVRRGSNSIPFTVEQLHRICQEGRTSVSERLVRIEAKLDSYAQQRQQQEAIGHQEAYSDEAQNRIQRVLADE